MAEVKTVNMTLGNYKNIDIAKPQYIVIDQQVEAAFRKEAAQFMQEIDVTDRPVKEGDIAVIDFIGSVDGVEFEGGSGTDYPLEIGSGTFIPGFEEQLIGAEPGQSVDVNVTFPENYGAPNLAGKAALFQCRVNSIKEKHIPEMSDEVREEIRRVLQEQQDQRAEEDYELMLLDEVIETSIIPVEKEQDLAELNTMVAEWKYVMGSRGIDPDQYFKMTGLSEEALREQLAPEAAKRLRRRLVLEAVANEEGCEADEADIDDHLLGMAEEYETTLEDVKDRISEDHITVIKADIRMRKALDCIKNYAAK